MELLESLQGFVGENLFLLSPVEQAWQPTDYLPDLSTDQWAHNLAQFRETAQRVSDDLLVILVGNLVTEEALPNYAVSLEQIAQDPTGTGSDPWARWLRGWTAEENRHGDLINAYHRPRGHALGRADRSPSDPQRLRAGVGSRVRGTCLCVVPGARDADHPRQCR